MEIFILLGVFLVLMFLMTRGARAAQTKQLEQRDKAVVLGNNVVTTSGFLGKIVDIDGEAVTLESPSGDETVWLRQSIVSEMEIPFGHAAEEDEGAEFDAEFEREAERAADDLTNKSPFSNDTDQHGNSWK